MPHVTLEYSDNILDDGDIFFLFEQLHDALVATAGCRMEDIKTRAYRCEHVRVGDGDARNAFASLTVALLEGRESNRLQEIGEACLALLETHFGQSLREQRCDLTVELRPMRRDSYFKVSSHPSWKPS